MEKFTHQEIQSWNVSSGGQPIQQTFISQTIEELDRIAGLLGINNDRLDKISSRTGERVYSPECSDKDVKKSPESSKEIIADLIGIIKSRLNYQEDRISEIERFI